MQTILFTIANNNNKISMNENLPKETKDMYSDNCKALIKEIEENKTNGKIYHFYGLEESLLSK